MKALLSLLITIMLSLPVVAQGTLSRNAVCGKKWHGVKYVEADGKSHTIPAEEVNNYITYGCNGKFTSVEGGKATTGTWKLDAKNKTLTTTQSQTSSRPVTITREVIAAGKDELVIKAQEADGSYRTVYFEIMN